MKKTLILLVIAALTFGACDKGFEEINTNPTKPTQLDPSTKLTFVQLYTGGSSYVATLFYNVIHLMQNVQQLNATSYVSFLYKEGNTNQFFEEQFSNTVKNVVDLEAQLSASEEPNAATDLAIVKIQRVLIFSRITDAYGDIPYSEAGKGFLEGIRFPKYDKQSDIYADMLLTLETAAATLGQGGATSSFGAADLMYGGDVLKWKKFANSLMLRLAMRMVNVDDAGAKAWATKAIAGGVMVSNEDIAYLKYENSANDAGPNVNPLTKSFTSRGSTQLKISKPFMDFMKTKGDPRVSVLCSTVDGDTDFALQTGQDIDDPARGNANSKPNINIFGGSGVIIYDAPLFFQTYAEVELMLAEAAERWGIAGGSTAVKTHYEDGVTAAMQYLSLYGHGVEITTAQIDDYLAANPFVPSEALKMINEQYWVATFGNGVESFSNWKRSGYPVLVPASVATLLTGGEIPRRLPYPGSEKLNNPEAVEAATIQQGGDDLLTRMWWDVN
ncbi:SusD/RagB family nutrient-binding outer membrane lipoprotein [Algibacter miyuki]|uniref:SusD/RagB family nutrient-binding outer membrane lipoprotein n=1 Tax=Algibacter miyuki TaxID=1306933 RepID=A0ABV5GZ34_9FLAO|nr:SusD/RagB family nutrient-binding outer membrane lipoprotein [Algibacter miyuki]MDN3666930.1 SusD/RagB family nutrient-binding outer membrane lipoprotein [Algibacter miyuki]